PERPPDGGRRAGRQADQDRAGRARAVWRGGGRMRWAVVAFTLFMTLFDAAGLAAAATLKATLISPENDPRLERTRLERAYLGHPGGPAADGVQVALDEGSFELEAAGAAVALSPATARSVEAARAAAQAAEKAGAALILTDLPAD